MRKRTDQPATHAELAELVRRHVRARELGARHYHRADLLLGLIMRSGMHAGDEIDLGNGKRARLNDNFAGQNKVFRSHGINRHEIELVPAL